MRWFLKSAVATLMVAAFLMAPGCPGTDFFRVDTGSVVVNVQGTNLGQTRFDDVDLQVAQIRIRPTDPDADAALGPNSIALLRMPQSVDLQAGQLLNPVPVHAGGYRIISITLRNIQLEDLNPPAMPATCMENFSLVPDPTYPIPIGSIQFANFGDPQFNVPAVGAQITLNIDEERLVLAYEASFGCRDQPGERCFFGRDAFDAPCQQFFDAATTAAAGPDIFSVD